ncbi:hypothetical protein E2562_017474 [Oryza meyeriana var. granulata]|uniref:Uncharacterized protein n=1 Tax=Oryza meyeriana var. granulata TaxID=110450 RepID=A0A6G1DXG9_9ORYZ|nr:hypothetical protein E2562_017474 [Oryza meyeriana var. granulata]
MDPTGSFPNDAGSSRNEEYLSPLHEALRGTTAIPSIHKDNSEYWKEVGFLEKGIPIAIRGNRYDDNFLSVYT